MFPMFSDVESKKVLPRHAFETIVSVDRLTIIVAVTTSKHDDGKIKTLRYM